MRLSSPFEELHKKFKASFSRYHNWDLPAHYGNIDAELSAIHNSCAIIDLSAFGRIEISGDDTDEFLEFLIPQSLKSLKKDFSEMTFVCDQHGALIDIIRVAKTARNTLILTTPPKKEQVLKVARHTAKIRNFDIQINDKTESTAMIGFYGPKAFDLLSSKLPFDISDVEPQEVKEVSMFVFSATLIRSGWLGVEGVELICNSSLASMATFAVAKLQDNGSVQPAGMECLNAAFVEASLPLSIDLCLEKFKITPASLNLTNRIDFNKDFLAKNALEKSVDKPSHIAVGIKVKSLHKTHKSLNLQYDDREIGHNDLLVFSQKLNCGIGIAFVEPSFSALTDEVQLTDSDVVLGAEISKLPFDKGIAGRIYNFNH